MDILQKIKEALEQGKPARAVEYDTPEDAAFAETLTLFKIAVGLTCRLWRFCAVYNRPGTGFLRPCRQIADEPQQLQNIRVDYRDTPEKYRGMADIA